MEKVTTTPSTNSNAHESFFREYTSDDAIRKYTRATAGYGISYLLDHDYKEIYEDAVALLPPPVKTSGIRILEFGCGGGMNLLHLVAALDRAGVVVARAVGTDFSPVLIEAAKREAKNYLADGLLNKLRFSVADNDSLRADLAAELKEAESRMTSAFDLIIGVNTIRYSHRSGKQFDCARDIFELLAPGGICVVIDMNDRFPAFRSALKNRFRGQATNEEECYLPSLEEYAAPFVRAGFEIVQRKHFCWIPHSAGELMTKTLRSLAPLLSTVASSRAMRSLVLARKPAAQRDAN